MKKQLQKLGMATAILFTMATTVAVAQCPTMNSLNLSTGPNGKIIIDANMSVSSYTGTFTEVASRNNGGLSFGISPKPSVPFSINMNSNGDWNFNVTYTDALGTCPTSSVSGNISVLNKIDSTNTCPKLSPLALNSVALGNSNNIEQIIFNYTGIVSSIHNISISVPAGITYTPVSIGVFNFTAPGIFDYTVTLSDPTNTICPSDVLVYSTVPTGSCSANASFVMTADSTSQGTYNLYNYSASTGTISYLWDFGDGSNSTLAYPTHTYAAAGFYTVCLTVTSSDGCYDTQCMLGGFKVSANGLMTKIVVKNPNATAGIDEQNMVNTLVAYPNPMSNELTIELDANITNTLVYSISDALGKIIASNKLNEAKTIVNTANFGNGFYFLTISNYKEQVLKTSKLVK